MSVPRLIWKRGLDSPNLASKVKLTFVFSEVVRQNLRISIDTLRLFRYFPFAEENPESAIRQDDGDQLEQEA